MATDGIDTDATTIAMARVSMSPDTEIAALRRKVTEEREKAQNAPDPAGYRRHTELARTYERQLRALYRDQGAASRST